MRLLPTYAMLEPLERLSVYTPLGIRFWDLVSDTAVVDGLEVTARPPHQANLSRRAFQTISGVYAFRDLPGLRSIELSDPDLPAGVHPIEESPPFSARFVIEVRDRLARFLPVTFQLDVPRHGIYPTQRADSPSGVPLPGFPLFSAPTRRTLSNLAIVRAQIVERLGGDRFRPAPFAVLELQITGGPTWLGIADEYGSAAVILPYPTFSTTLRRGSPPSSSPEAHVQAWEVCVGVRYGLASQTKPDSSASLPELGAILAQPWVGVWETEAGLAQVELTDRLVFGQPLVLKTVNRSELWIGT